MELSDRQDVKAIAVTQPTYPVLLGKADNVIIHLTLSVDSGSVLNQIHLSTAGTTSLSDIEGVRIYYSGNSADYSSEEQFGEDLAPASSLVFADTKVLQAGDNHFWVSYELKKSANIDHLVSGSIRSVVINEIETPVSIQPSPQRMGIALRKRGDDGVNAYRIPGLATTNDGTLIAVYDVRYNSSVDLQEDIDVGMSRSTDGGRTWEPMKVITDMSEWGGLPEASNGVGDPSVLVDRATGTIWVAALWAHGYPDERAWFASGFGMKPEETGQFVLVKSEDDGLTWSEPINITSQIKDPNWQLLLAGPGKGISLKDGTLVFPAQFKDKDKVPHSTLITSADHGVTWQIGTGVRAETTEAQLIELPDGGIMINCRNNYARDSLGVGRYVAVTKDLGQSWQEHSSSVTGLEESTCMASLILGSSQDVNDLLLFSNPNTHTGRFNMTIKTSTDQGQTWPEENWLLLDEGRSWGYSCMTMIDEQYIGILYEGSQANLTFQRIAIRDLINEE